MAAPSGAVVAIAAGSYAESVSVDDKALTLWGKCAAEVEIVSPLITSVRFGSGSGGSVLRGVALSGRGIIVTGTGMFQIDRVWIHDVGDYGIYASASGDQSASITLVDSLIERAHNEGVFMRGNMLVERSVVRDVSPGGQTYGMGIISATKGIAMPAQLTVLRSLIERTVAAGVYSDGGILSVETSVVRDVALGTGIGDCIVGAAGDPVGTGVSVMTSLIERCAGDGVAVQVPLAARANVFRHIGGAGQANKGAAVRIQEVDGAMAPIGQCSLRDSLIHDADSGLVSMGGDCDLIGVVVRDIGGGDITMQPTAGILFQASAREMPPIVSLRALVISGVAHIGVELLGVSATLDNVSVSGVRDRGNDVSFPAGVYVQSLRHWPAHAQIRTSSVDTIEGVGIAIIGATAVIDSTRVAAITPSASGDLGRGIYVQHAFNSGATASATITRSLVDGVEGEMGIGAFASRATIDRTVVTNVQSGPTLLGDGIVAAHFDTVLPPITEVELTRSLVSAVARAGIGNFGAVVRAAASTIDCAGIDLDGESTNGGVFEFHDDGGNRCGCAGESRPCVVRSTMLSSPMIAASQ